MNYFCVLLVSTFHRNWWVYCWAKKSYFYLFRRYLTNESLHLHRVKQLAFTTENFKFLYLQHFPVSLLTKCSFIMERSSLVLCVLIWCTCTSYVS